MVVTVEFDEFGRRGHLLWLLKINWNERLRFPSRFLMIPDPMEATREAQSGSVVLFSGMSGFRSCLDQGGAIFNTGIILI